MSRSTRPPDGDGDLTLLLRAWSSGEREAAERLLPLVYDDLRRRAARQLRRERAGHSLRPTALVHEAWLRLAGQAVPWQNRLHFYAFAARAMRQVLVDHARRRDAVKRAGAWRRITLDEALAARGPAEVDVLELHRALEELAQLDAEQARLVELRFFAGLSVDETAAALGVSAATVTRQWRLVRAWLFRRLGGTG